jgi:hypothetical protein
MKKILLFLFLLLQIDLIYAQVTTIPGEPPGFYALVGRMNDPFVFCTEGVPQDNWRPTDPTIGAWTCIVCTAPVNMTWISTYQSICPLAGIGGPWTGPGMGDQWAATPVPPSLIPLPH